RAYRRLTRRAWRKQRQLAALFRSSWQEATIDGKKQPALRFQPGGDEPGPRIAGSRRGGGALPAVRAAPAAPLPPDPARRCPGRGRAPGRLREDPPARRGPARGRVEAGLAAAGGGALLLRRARAQAPRAAHGPRAAARPPAPHRRRRGAGAGAQLPRATATERAGGDGARLRRGGRPGPDRRRAGPLPAVDQQEVEAPARALPPLGIAGC